MARGRRRKSRSSLDPTLSRGVLSILLVIFSIIITLSFFGKAGTVGIMLNDYFLSFLFGSIRFTTPVILLVLAWYLIRDVDYNYRPTHGIGAVLFFLSLSSIMHLRFAVSEMWMQSLAGNGGGVFGMLAWVLKSYLGTIASWVLLIGLVFVSIFLIFNTSVANFVEIHRKLFRSFGALGKLIVGSMSMLFSKKPEYESDEEYDEDDDEYEDDEEEAPTKRRRFFRKDIGEDEEEEYDEDEDDDEYEDDEEEDDQEIQAAKSAARVENTEPKKDDVWSKKVIIRKLPSVKLLSSKKGKPTSGDIKANAKTIQDTLAEFKIDVTMGEIKVGPTVTQYRIKPAKGIKLTKITSLSNDLALALAAHPIRIEAPIPGKSLVGIEVPNEKTALVSFKELILSKSYKERAHDVMVALGKDVGGKVWFADLPKMPHMLIAGATGSGKTVCVNTIIMSLLFQNTAETLRMIMIDPKRVELTMYNGIPHLLTPVITNTQQTVNALRWSISEMERRFETFAAAGSRDITSYNKKHPEHKMPQIVIVIDELADLMATAANEVEAGIIRLAQMARAVGIHLVLATQRPSVDVITGLMKANIPARIAFSVASLTDSRTILDCPGAEKLIGRGDMLFQTASLSKPVRIQGAFISEEELKTVVNYLKGKEKPEYDTSIIEKPKDGGTMSLFGGPSDDQDPLFNEARNVIIEAGKASASLLQRRLKVGYARAARILDELEEAGIVGPSQGAKPRELLVTTGSVAATMGAGGEHNVFDTPEEEIEEEFEEDDEIEEEDFDEEDNEMESDDEYEEEDESEDDDEDLEEEEIEEEELEEEDEIEEEDFDEEDNEDLEDEEEIDEEEEEYEDDEEEELEEDENEKEE